MAEVAAPARRLRLDQVKLLLATFVVGIHTGLADRWGAAAAPWVRQGLLDVAVPTFFVMQGYFAARTLGRAGFGRQVLAPLAAMYLFWSMPLAYLQRAQGPWPLVVAVFTEGLGALWYLLAAWLALAGLNLVVRWLGGRPLLWLALVLGATGWWLARAAASGAWPGLAASDPPEAGLLRNVLFFAAPCLAWGAWLAREGGQPLAGALSTPWRAGAAMALGAAGVLSELACSQGPSGLAPLGRPLLLGHPLWAAGLLAWGLQGQRFASGRFWAAAPSVVYVSHQGMNAVVWKLGWQDQLPLTEAAVLGALLLTPLLLPLWRRWRWLL